MTNATLILEDGTTLTGRSFGAERSVSAELVFTTGMVGYPQSMTDPSFARQILIFTYPSIGNYGVGGPSTWESDRVQTAAIIVSTYNETPSHFAKKKSLSEWLIEQNVPGLEIRDTRFLAKKLRAGGSQLAKIVFEGRDIPFDDPNTRNLVAEVSPKTVTTYGNGKKTIVYVDCGGKNRIIQNFVERGVTVIRVPWNYDIFSLKERFHGVFISNGPGDPKMVPDTIATIRKVLKTKIPILGICLGNQLLALAAGGDTYKLKFGHRSQNQPCIEVGTKRCYLTTQNHGFAVGRVPHRFRPWFVNANDQTNEGIVHDSLPFMSVQFHPEATPGPVDVNWIFDHFLKKV